MKVFIEISITVLTAVFLLSVGINWYYGMSTIISLILLLLGVYVPSHIMAMYRHEWKTIDHGDESLVSSRTRRMRGACHKIFDGIITLISLGNIMPDTHGEYLMDSLKKRFKDNG